MEKLTWKEWIRARWYYVLFVFIFFGGIGTGCIYCIVTAASQYIWTCPLLVVALAGIAAMFIAGDKGEIRRCSHCQEITYSLSYIRCPNCGTVCPKCGHKIEKE